MTAKILKWQHRKTQIDLERLWVVRLYLLIIADRVPKNTTLTATWAHSMWYAWCKAHKIEKPVAKMSLEEMDKYLSHNSYLSLDATPTHLKHRTSSCAVYNDSWERMGGQKSLFWWKHPVFDRSRKALDAQMKQLTMWGVGTTTNEFWATDSRAGDSPLGQRCILRSQC